jgi:5-methylcytosine-specific restriction enzyme subunit McrC
MSTIPIQNIYYLLCYAWNTLDAKDRVAVQIDDAMTILDLFASILLNGSKILLKRGIDKEYRRVEEEVVGIKGKIAVGQTLKSNLLARQRTVCAFDEYSEDILINRILLSTIITLIRTQGLDPKLRKSLASLRFRFDGIQIIKLSERVFNSVKLNKNNGFYGFLLQVCQMVYVNSLPSETPGLSKFMDFTRDENKMNVLYEAFLRNFYRREQHTFNRVGRSEIRWKFNGCSAEYLQFVPRMETDITLENDKKRIIIDAKYYQTTMTSRYDTEKIHTGNLYQLFSYLINQEDGSEKTLTTKGILLYPKVAADYDLTYWYNRHSIRIKTIDLAASQATIAQELLRIIQ